MGVQSYSPRSRCPLKGLIGPWSKTPPHPINAIFWTFTLTLHWTLLLISTYSVSTPQKLGLEKGLATGTLALSRLLDRTTMADRKVTLRFLCYDLTR